MLLLTNCTFDGVVYNPRRVMEEVLAIKPDICFLWDEAWYAFATAVPWARQRTAMVAAEQLESMLSSLAYAEEYRMRGRDGDAGSRPRPVDQHRLLPDPSRARVRVYATHSTHKSLSALRQASMVHIRDQDFNWLTPRFVRLRRSDPHLDVAEPATAGIAGFRRDGKSISRGSSWSETSMTWRWCSVTASARTA